MKKALICGISGQDGAYLARLLLEKGYEVIGSSRDAQLASFANLRALGIFERVQLHSMAMNDFRSVLQLLTKTNPDEIYNLAGQTSVALSFDQPVETMESISLATLNLLEAIRFLGKPARLYNACSSECFGDVGGVAADERTPFRPGSPYAVAKAAAFWEVASYRDAYGIYACSGILFNHESPLRHHRFVTRKIVESARLIAAGAQDKLFLGDVTVTRDWGWAPDYVEGMWRMLRADHAVDYVLATGEPHSIKEFCELAFRHEGVQISWKGAGYDTRGFDGEGREIIVVDPRFIRPAEIHSSFGNSSRARTELGWAPSTTFSSLVAGLFG